MTYSFFFFSSRRRHTRLQGDWSSDVCSSDLRTPNRSRSGECGADLEDRWAMNARTAAARTTSNDVKRSEEHTSELQSPCNLVCRLLLEKKKRMGNSVATARRGPINEEL